MKHYIDTRKILTKKKKEKRKEASYPEIEKKKVWQLSSTGLSPPQNRFSPFLPIPTNLDVFPFFFFFVFLSTD